MVGGYRGGWGEWVAEMLVAAALAVRLEGVVGGLMLEQVQGQGQWLVFAG